MGTSSKPVGGGGIRGGDAARGGGGASPNEPKKSFASCALRRSIAGDVAIARAARFVERAAESCGLPRRALLIRARAL